jgi:hypothetical protein
VERRKKNIFNSKEGLSPEKKKKQIDHAKVLVEEIPIIIR